MSDVQDQLEYIYQRLEELEQKTSEEDLEAPAAIDLFEEKAPTAEEEIYEIKHRLDVIEEDLKHIAKLSKYFMELTDATYNNRPNSWWDTETRMRDIKNRY